MDIRAVDECIEEATATQNPTLNLSHRNISIVPSSIQNARMVQILLLNNNSILIPPSELCLLNYLQELILDDNKLTMLPLGMGNLVNLRILSVSENPLSMLPEDIGDLVLLEQLWVNHTQITSIPSNISKLKRLKKFGLKGNYLSSFPEEIIHLSRLHWMNASNNKLTQLPSKFHRLTSLSYLNLDCNEFSCVPGGVCDLPGLVVLSMKGNPIDALKDDVLLELSALEKIDLRDTRIETKPDHWKGLDYIQIGKTGLDEETIREIQKSSQQEEIESCESETESEKETEVNNVIKSETKFHNENESRSKDEIKRFDFSVNKSCGDSSSNDIETNKSVVLSESSYQDYVNIEISAASKATCKDQETSSKLAISDCKTDSGDVLHHQGDRLHHQEPKNGFKHQQLANNTKAANHSWQQKPIEKNNLQLDLSSLTSSNNTNKNNNIDIVADETANTTVTKRKVRGVLL